MNEDFYTTKSGGVIPTGLPGGFFIYEADGDETLLYAEPNVIRLYGCDSYEEFYEYVGGSFKGMVHPEDIHKVENQITAQTVATDKRHDYVRYRIITKSGEEKFIEDFGHLLHWRNGKSFFYVFIVDVDQNEYFNKNRNSFAEAELLSSHRDTDPLTGLFNMSFFYQTVQIFRIGNAFQVTVFFPHGVHVGDLLIIGQFDILFIFRKDQVLVQDEEQKNNNNAHRDKDGYDPPDQTNKKISHIRILRLNIRICCPVIDGNPGRRERSFFPETSDTKEFESVG